MGRGGRPQEWGCTMRRRLPAIPGRFWWAEALGAMAAGAGAVIGPVWYLSAQLSFDEQFGFARGIDLALSSGFILVFLLLAAVLIYYGARDLYRWRTRRTALLSDESAIPLARSLAMSAEPQDVSHQGLELLWSATRGQQWLAAPLTLVLAFLDLGMLALSVVVIMTGLFGSKTSLPAALRDVLLAGIALVIVATTALVVQLMRLMPTYFGQPYGVVASDAGLECRTEFGRRFTVAWGDARLFEVESRGGGRVFHLYGAHQIATWRVPAPSSSGFEPAGISGPEMALRLDALTALIVARTGLAPRTFTRSLARMPQSQPANASRLSSVVGYGFVLVFALICLGTAAWTLVFPPMSVGDLNAVFAIAPTLTGVGLLIALSLLLARQRGNRQSSSDLPYQPRPVVAPPPSLPADTTFSFQGGLSTLQRLACVAYGILALPDFIPIVVLFGMPMIGSFGSLFGSTFRTSAPHINSSVGGFFVGYLLFIFGVCGLFAFRVARRGTLGSAVYANKQGIGAGSNRAAVAIPWTAIGRITARFEGHATAYVIYGSRTRIQVRDNLGRRHLLHALPGTSIITPGELAALASERSGKPIEWT